MPPTFLQHLLIPNICQLGRFTLCLYPTILILVFCSWSREREKRLFMVGISQPVFATTNLPFLSLIKWTHSEPLAVVSRQHGWLVEAGTFVGALVIPTGWKDNQGQKGSLRHCPVCPKINPVIPPLWPRNPDEGISNQELGDCEI